MREDISSTWPPLEEDERYRLADRLRQGPGQVLANVLVDLRALLSMPMDNEEKLRQALETIMAEVEAGYWELQEIVEEVRPPFIFRELGLTSWMHTFAERYRDRYRLDVQVEAPTTELPLATQVADAFWRVVVEALRNVREHAHASRVVLRLYEEGPNVVLEVEDDGRGLSEEALQRAYQGIHPKLTFGLMMMQRWLERVGGRLEVKRGREGGTLVRAIVPQKGREAGGDA